MKALVLGANGQLGTELVRVLGEDSAIPHSALSVTDEAAVDSLISARKPEVVFNCAAYNAVDRAESEKDVAFAINADGPGHIATACHRYGAWFRILSRDNRRYSDEKSPAGKVDYHTMGACYEVLKVL